MSINTLFNSRIFYSFLVFILIAAMVRLGFWQLERSRFKQDRQLKFQQRSTHDILELPPELISSDDWIFFRVSVIGEFLAEQGFLVDNVIHNSMPGVSVVTPLRIAQSEATILVDRGWLSWGRDRTFLPSVETPVGKVELRGLLVAAIKNPFYLKDPEKSGERKQLWSQLDIQRFIQGTHNPVLPVILILDQNQTGGFKHIWKPQDDSWIARHKAYALQWFALALTLLFIYLLMSYKLWKKTKQHDRS